MALTRDFKETVKARATRDPEFRNGLLTEALEAMVLGEIEVAKILLRDYINATVGFKPLGVAVGKSPKSLMRMLSRGGNPSVQNLLRVTRYLQNHAGVRFRLVADSPVRKSQKKRLESTNPKMHSS